MSNRDDSRGKAKRASNCSSRLDYAPDTDTSLKSAKPDSTRPWRRLSACSHFFGETSLRRLAPSMLAALLLCLVWVPARAAAAKPPEAAPSPVVPASLVLIAHNAGDEAGTERRALAGQADVIEINVAFIRGSLRAVDRSRFGSLALSGRALSTAWVGAAGAKAIELDLKSTSPSFVRRVNVFLSSHQGARLYIASADRRVLGQVGQGMPQVTRLLSVKDRQGLAEALVMSPGPEVNGVTIKHSLLTSDVVTRLHSRGLSIYAWTVNEPTRVRQLVALGIQGLATDNLAAMRRS